MTKTQNEKPFFDRRFQPDEKYTNAAKLDEVRSRQRADDHLCELKLRYLNLEMQNEELQRVHAALAASRDRFLQLYDFAPVCYLTLTEDGLITEANQTCATLLGVERKTLINNRFAHYVIPEEGDRWHRHFLHAKRKGGKQKYQLTLRNADGTSIKVHVDCLHMETEDAPPVLRITLTDISNCSEVKKALREIEIHHSHALACAELGTWYWNIKTGHIDFSERWAETRGYRLEEIEPHISVLENGIHPDDLPDLRAALSEHLTGHSPYFQVEYRIQHQSGQTIWVLDRGTVIERDAEGNPLRMAGTEMVITERKQAEEALRIAAAAFETQEGIIVTDAHKIILRINQAFSRITGYSAKYALGHTPSFLRSGLYDDEFYQVIVKAIARDGYWQGEIWDKHKNGEVLPLWLTITAIIDPHGKLTHYVGSFMDISAHKQAEKVLLDARQCLENQVANTQVELEKIKEESAEVNTALNVLLKYRETDKSEAQSAHSHEMEGTILPFLKKLKKASTDRNQIRLIDILETNLLQLVKSYGRATSLHSAYQQLTHTEIQVASLIRQGLSTKRIASALNISSGTVSIHRKHIRKKLELDGKSTNLHSYLLSLAE